MKLHSKDWWDGYHTAQDDLKLFGLEWAEEEILGADLRGDYDCGYVFAGEQRGMKRFWKRLRFWLRGKERMCRHCCLWCEYAEVCCDENDE